MHAVKKNLFAWLERNRGAIAELSDCLFYFGEPGLEEYESSALLTGLLEEAGFHVERGISGFPTAFLATWGTGRPVIAMHAEYDAAPNNSQLPGVTEQRAIVEGAPGHCEGHNVNAAVLVAAAVAVKRAMEESGLAGTLKVFGAPAEELLLTRPYFVRDGYFDDVDVAFHDHIGGDFSTEYGLVQIAALSAEFTFHGETAHAGLSPWNGRDALDGVVLMDMGMAQYREHMRPTMRAHRVITNGGDQPNVIPAQAAVWWYFRDPTAAGVRTLFAQAKRIAKGAAMMTNTAVTVDVKSAVWPVRCNEVLAQIIQRNIEQVGMPDWTGDEQNFARALQSAAGTTASGLRTSVAPLDGPATAIAASNDCGDISWKVPMGRLWFPGTVPNIIFHHWTGGAPLTTSIAHKGALAGAKALAGSVVDCLLDPHLIERAKRVFHDEVGDVVYEPLLPADQKPRLDVNRAVMERYRPLLQAYAPKTRPRFV